MKKTFKLPKEFGERWLTALRSGDYKQGESFLLQMEFENTEYYPEPINGTERYCCLGVAGKICGANDNDLMDVELLSNNNAFIELDIPEILLQVAEWDEDKLNIVDCLTSLNDGLTETRYNKILKFFPNIIFRKSLDRVLTKFNFNEIADFIEDNTEFI